MRCWWLTFFERCPCNFSPWCFSVQDLTLLSLWDADPVGVWPKCAWSLPGAEPGGVSQGRGDSRVPWLRTMGWLGWGVGVGLDQLWSSGVDLILFPKSWTLLVSIEPLQVEVPTVKWKGTHDFLSQLTWYERTLLQTQNEEVSRWCRLMYFCFCFFNRTSFLADPEWQTYAASDEGPKPGEPVYIQCEVDGKWHRGCTEDARLENKVIQTTPFAASSSVLISSLDEKSHSIFTWFVCFLFAEELFCEVCGLWLWAGGAPVESSAMQSGCCP